MSALAVLAALVMVGAVINAILAAVAVVRLRKTTRAVDNAIRAARQNLELISQIHVDGISDREVRSLHEVRSRLSERQGRGLR